jgi:hypothetical protein
MTASFPVEYHRATASLRIMFVIGFVAFLFGLIDLAIKGASPLDHPLGLLGLLLCVPGIWIVGLGLLSTFSLRVTEDTLQKVLWNHWVISSQPIRALQAARIKHNTLELDFSSGSRIRIAAMPLRDIAGLASLLEARCAHARLE